MVQLNNYPAYKWILLIYASCVESQKRELSWNNHTETFLDMRNGIFRKSYFEADPCPEPEYTHFGDVLDTQIPEC